jgi:hypothetical protein
MEQRQRVMGGLRIEQGARELRRGCIHTDQLSPGAVFDIDDPADKSACGSTDGPSGFDDQSESPPHAGIGLFHDPQNHFTVRVEFEPMLYPITKSESPAEVQKPEPREKWRECHE